MDATPVHTQQSPSGIELTWGRSAKIFWSISWRAMLVGVLVGAIVAIPMVILQAATAPAFMESPLMGLVQALIGIAGGIWAVRAGLRATWSDFTIILVPRGAET